MNLVIQKLSRKEYRLYEVLSFSLQSNCNVSLLYNILQITKKKKKKKKKNFRITLIFSKVIQLYREKKASKSDRLNKMDVSSKWDLMQSLKKSTPRDQKKKKGKLTLTITLILYKEKQECDGS